MKLLGLILAVLLACGQAEARMAQNSSGRPAVGTPPVQQLSSVSLRTSSPIWVTVGRVTAGGTFRLGYEISAPGTVRAIVVCYANVASTGIAETDGPSSMAGLTSSIEYNTSSPTPFDVQVVPKQQAFTFNLGTRAIPALDVAGGLICSDPWWHDFTPGQWFEIRTYAPPGFPYATYQGLLGANFEYTNSGGFIVINTVTTGDGVSTVYNGAITQATSLGNPALTVNLPLRANTLSMAIGTGVIQDDGAGHWVNSVGTLLDSNGVNTIDYDTGAFTVTTLVPLPNGTSFVEYGLSLGNSIAPDDTMTPHPPTFFSRAGSSFIATAIPTVGPAMILGYVDAGATVADTLCDGGDSISSSIGNTENKNYAEYSVNNRIGIVRVGQGGERAADWAQFEGRKRRMNMLIAAHCTRMLTGYGHNDVTQLYTLDQIETNLLATWASLAAIMPHGYADITQTTITPYTDLANNPINNSTYGPDTVESGHPSIRNALNFWICGKRGQPDGPGQILDLARAVELNPDSCGGAGDGKWIDRPGMTADGRHMNHNTQAVVIPAMFGPNGSSPAPVFLPSTSAYVPSP